MKILKIKARRRQAKGHTSYHYPVGYDASKINVLGYESMSDKGKADIISRGNFDEYLIGVVSDNSMASFTQSDDIVEINREEAISLGGEWIKQVEKVLDERRVLAVCAKAALGKKLNNDEKEILDPKSETTGINITKSFTQRLDQVL